MGCPRWILNSVITGSVSQSQEFLCVRRPSLSVKLRFHDGTRLENIVKLAAVDLLHLAVVGKIDVRSGRQERLHA